MVLYMGHLYSIMDMKDDLSKDIINIPKEELILLELNNTISYDKVRKNQDLKILMDNEVNTYNNILKEFKLRLQYMGDKNSRKVCLPLVGAMNSFCNKYSKIKDYKALIIIDNFCNTCYFISRFHSH